MPKYAFECFTCDISPVLCNLVYLRLNRVVSYCAFEMPLWFVFTNKSDELFSAKTREYILTAKTTVEYCEVVCSIRVVVFVTVSFLE